MAQRFMGREEFRKKQELDEARKAGTAPAEVDEDGNEINPHIPEFMAKAPWYFGSDGPSLKHTKNLKKEAENTGNWYRRGQKSAAPARKRFAKGACANCGAVSHKTRDCVERPRKKGAKWTGKDMQRDELVDDVKLDYAGKRDRWNGYDPASYKDVVKRHELLEAERKRTQQAALDAKLQEEDAQRAKDIASGKIQPKAKKDKAPSAPKAPGDVSGALDSDSDSDEEGLVDDAKQTGGESMFAKNEASQSGGASKASRMTVRNLRCREDTAKYLVNLDLGSAFYDPKTRSMRANPYDGLQADSDTGDLFKGDNFERVSGDAVKMAQLQAHAFEAYDHGLSSQDLHLQAMPSQAELLKKQFDGKKKDMVAKQQQRILDKYGGTEHMKAPDSIKGSAQTERYLEYSRDGCVVGGQKKALPKSKYDEDVFEFGHTTVWGSFCVVGDGNVNWGYRCCEQHDRSASGGAACALWAQSNREKLKQQRKAAAAAARAALMPPPTDAQSAFAKNKKPEAWDPEEIAKARASGIAEEMNTATHTSGYGEGKIDEVGDEEVDEDKVQEFMKAQNAPAPEEEESLGDDRKRKYNSELGSDVHVSKEEMEAYRRQKERWGTAEGALEGLGEDELLPLDHAPTEGTHKAADPRSKRK